jgi:hypothetical protein
METIMTAPLRHPVAAARADPLKAFELRCWARALLWREGEIDLHEAVNELQASAVRDELVASIGQDAVQAVLAKAFGAVRDDAGSDMMPDALPEPRRVERVPLSTLLAAEYLARENDPKRLRAWLTKHSARERVAIHKHLRGRR